MDVDAVIVELHQRLQRHPPERYPVQHATDRFHLAQAQLQAGRPAEAVAALETSLRLFPEPMAVERAKVRNLLGAALRELGSLDEAAACFTEASAAFAGTGLPTEEGAALFNLGLVRRDRGDAAGAVTAFTAAAARFAGGPPAARAAAALHLGSALLAAGDPHAAVAPLEAALDLADRLGDREGLGAAANALGLAHLAADRPAAAVEALARAAAAHPRSVRPAEHAMAKANLALAHERAGAAARARLAATQALAVADAPPPVRAQATAVLDRLGAEVTGDVLVVLDDEPPERWLAVVREDLVRWAAAGHASRRAEARAWIAGQHARHEVAEHLAAAWLGALVELPPTDMDAVIVATLQASADVDREARERFRATVRRAMARFPVPQLVRVSDRFDALAAELGQEPAWS